LIFVFFLLPLSAQDKFYLDNETIQFYRGALGQWKFVHSKNELKNLAKKHNTTLRQIEDVNRKRTGVTKYFFIPYSKKTLTRLRNAGKGRTSFKASPKVYLWPVTELKRISSGFGVRWGAFHTGVDLPAPKGTLVLAAMDGMVISAKYSGGHGKSIYIEHRDNFYTRYSHNSVMLVKMGEFVRKGQVIAHVGSTGRSTGNHLHFEIRYNSIPLNPLDFLPRKSHLQKARLASEVE